jgi:hypothetical protein
MAKKKVVKEVVDTKEVVIILQQLIDENEKYAGDLAGYLQDRIGTDLKVARDGNKLKLTVHQSFSRRIIKTHLKKFLYLANLTTKFRPITILTEERGYEIHKKPTFE